MASRRIAALKKAASLVRPGGHVDRQPCRRDPGRGRFSCASGNWPVQLCVPTGAWNLEISFRTIARAAPRFPLPTRSKRVSSNAKRRARIFEWFSTVVDDNTVVAALART